MRYARLAAFLFLQCLYLSVSLVLFRLFPQAKRRRWRVRWSSWIAPAFLAALGIRVHVYGDAGCPARGGPGRLRVSNHVSDVDAVILNALSPSVFVTSREMEQGFWTGLISRAGGCVFVDRTSPAGLREEIRRIAALLRAGENVVLFAEGTSTNGEALKPFKSPLFTAAIDAGADIEPVALRYVKVRGEPLNERNRDLVFYYGDMSFGGHLLRLMEAAPVDVAAHVGATLSSASLSDRKGLAAETQRRISALLERAGTISQISQEAVHGGQESSPSAV